MTKGSLDLTVGIATTGRREQLTLTVMELGRQLRPPTRLVICPAGEEDFDQAVAASVPFPVTVVMGPRGLPAQRNCILAECAQADAVVFFDDDFYPAPTYLGELESVLLARPEAVIITGSVWADGASGPGLMHDEAVRALESLPPLPPPEEAHVESYGGYGCNMAIRMRPVIEHGIRFDENLPLYAWLEDIDFSRRLAPFGPIVRSFRLRGVHLGVKRGRTSGLKFGYSQIANPVYMWRKGSMTRSYALRHMVRNVARNLARSLAPEPWVDRRGRLKGNALAIVDLLRGSLDPRNILQLD